MYPVAIATEVGITKPAIYSNAIQVANVLHLFTFDDGEETHDGTKREMGSSVELYRGTFPIDDRGRRCCIPCEGSFPKG
ncbi:hypothetical protein BBR47_30700 [Brevibacillus brevis NBRC 100599]|uniref:Uncharacterized protein n=1 Tax=Brevibacillus brevis (strain 47 / JCM 6285 / NBRC 100599) TaxID=358681 RepID=C0ZE38_BREBN|nr:hypothetical protein BBR47_30700 [Brevibacillus brevis NBRC 100599]